MTKKTITKNAIPEQAITKQELVSQVEELRRRLEGTEQALREAHERAAWLARFPAENPNPVMQVSADGRVLYCNPAAARLPGWACEVGQLLPDRLLRLVDLAMEQGQEVEQDVQLAERFYVVSAMPFPGEYANLYGRDVTERKQAEEQLRCQAALLANVNDAIIASDAQYRLTAWNAAAESLYGWKAGEVIGRNGLEILRTEWPQDAAEMRRMIAETGRWRGEATQARKDGARVPVELSSMVLRDESGQITGYVSVNRDITERQRAEEALRESEQRFRLALKHAPVSVATQDRDLHFMWAYNQRTVDPAAILGKTDMDLFPPEDAARLIALKRKVLETEAETRERLWLTSGGKRVFIDLYLAPMRDTSGQVNGIGIATVDLTQMKLVEDALRESEERYRTLFNEMTEGFAVHEIVCDERGEPCDYVFLDVNPSFERLTGLPRDQVVGRAVSEVLPGNEPHWVKTYGQVALTGQPVHFDSHATALGRHYEVFAYCPAPRQFAALFMDVTERKQVEQQRAQLLAQVEQERNRAEALAGALQAERDLLQVVMENTRTHLAYLDPQFNFVLANAAYAQGSGHAKAELVGRNHFDLFPNRDNQAIFQRVVDTGQPVELHAKPFEFADQPWRGVTYWDWALVPVKDQHGQVQGLAFSLENVTESVKAAEELRRARDELEQRVQERTQELAQANEDLRRASAYNRSLIEASLDPLVTIGLDGRITDVNTATEHVTGRPRVELIGTDFSDYFTQPGKARAGYQQVFREGEVRDYELAVRHRDTHVTPVLYNASVYRDEAGHVAGVFAAARDITERKQAEKALKAERQRFNDVLEMLPAYLILLSPDYTVPFANRYFRERFGDSNGRRCYEYLFGRTEPCEVCETYKVLKPGAPLEWEWTGPDGRDYDVFDFPFTDSDGSRLILEMGIDVTERKRAEAQLEQNNRELRALSEAERKARRIAETLAAANLALTQTLDQDAVMETLLDHVGQLVPYDSANILLLETESQLAVRVIRGYERWTDPQQVHAITFDAQASPIFRALLDAQKSVLIPDTRTCPDWQSPPGTEHVRNWLGVPIVAAGRVIGVYSLDKAEPGFFTEEHVRLAEALVGQAAVAIQNAWLFTQVRAGRERLQSLSRRLVEVQEAERHYVARELHDEAGQALTSLMFGLGQLEQELDRPQRSARVAGLKAMTNEVLESLHRLAMDLRPASLDHLGLEPALNQYVTAIGRRFGLIAQFKAVGLAGKRLPPATETALYRIVQEALTNAARHAHATRVDVLLERRGDQVVIVVEDDGAGFEADLARLAQSGHLGLVGMQERAEMLGGSLVIESAAGAGTTIVVEVPYAD